MKLRRTLTVTGDRPLEHFLTFVIVNVASVQKMCVLADRDFLSLSRKSSLHLFKQYALQFT
jgi:hypothetical protein